MVVGLVYDTAYELHAPPTTGKQHWHIETPERVSVIYAALGKAKLLDKMERVPAQCVTRAEAEACHTAEHCDALEALAEAAPQVAGAWAGSRASGSTSSSRATGWLRNGNDMYHNEHTARTARLAAGGVVALTSRVVTGRLSSGVALVRPPGHHACQDRMAGFCFLNSVAIAARQAIRRHGLARVLIVDWDVHHGDGTQAIFEDDPSVLYMSLHRFGHNFFPGTGAAAQVGIRLGAGHTVNVPWRREGMGDAEYLAAFDALLMPIARAFDPELVLVSAGFDAASGDRVGGMALTAEAFAGMTARLGTLAAGKLVLALEGGYRPALAAKGLLACARVLLGDPAVGPAARPPPLGTDPSLDGIARSAHRVLLEVLRAQADHWPLLKGTALSNHHTLPLRLSETPSEGSDPPPRYSETPSDCSDADVLSVVVAHPPVAGAGCGRPERPSRPAEALADLAEEDEADVTTPATARAVRREAALGSVGKPAGAAVPAPAVPDASGVERLECCRACRCWRPRSAFSATQLKRRVAGERVCRACSVGQAQMGATDQKAERAGGAAEPADGTGGGAPGGRPDSSWAWAGDT